MEEPNRSALAAPAAVGTLFPDDLRAELDTLSDYSFDYDSARFTSYECWHINGTHSIVSDIPVLARVSLSQRSLRLEQEFTVVRHLQRIDPLLTHFIRGFEFYRLKNTGAVVSIFEYIGENALNDFSMALTSTEYVTNDDHELVSSISSTAAPKKVITLPQFLDFAIAAAECLEVLHSAHGMVHGEIRDDAFLYNSEIHVVKIIHLGVSTHSAQSGVSLADSISGMIVNSTLSSKYVYISPEQTGHASLAVDYRTDIYSLGIVFYSVLTSRLPFYGSAMSVMHQILHSPVPSIEISRPDIPPVIDLLIQKMTAKQASKRYLSAAGLRFDLIEVRDRLRSYDSSAVFGEFQLGQNDISSIFTLPTEMIGRSAERDAILSIIKRFSKRRASSSSTVESRSRIPGSNAGISDATYSNSGTEQSEYGSVSDSSTKKGSSRLRSASISTRKQSRNCTEIISVRGYAGIGKSMLISSLQSPARNYGLYAKTRAQRNSRSAFEPLVEALSLLLQQVLSEKPELVQSFHTALRSKLGSQWQQMRRMSAVIPELKSFMDMEREQRSELFQSSLFHISKENGSQTSFQSNEPPRTVNSDMAAAEDTISIRGGSMTRASQISLNSLNFSSASMERPGAHPDLLLKNTAGNKMLVASFILQLFRILSESFTVAFVLGDIHNADDETVEVLQAMIQSRIELVIIMTHRDGVALPRQLQEFLESDYSYLTKLFIKSLSRAAVEQFVLQTMHCEAQEVAELVDFLLENSKGNPLVLSELMKALYKDKAIRFSTRRRKWVCSGMDAVHDTYVKFMSSAELDHSLVVRRFRDFPKRTRNFMTWASLLTSPFSFRLVQKLMLMPDGLSSSDSGDVAALENEEVTVFDSDDKAISSLQTLLQGGIIIRADDSEDKFQFSHVRYSQAAQALVRSENLASMNLLLAETLMTCKSSLFYKTNFVNADFFFQLLITRHFVYLSTCCLLFH